MPEAGTFSRGPVAAALYNCERPLCYTAITMDVREVRAYVERDWAAVAADKREHWVREFAARGPLATFEASQALWRHMRLLHPDWPSEDERREDLTHHVTLKRALDRAASAVRALTPR